MECVDCGKNIPSFVLRCTECQRKYNLAKASQPRYTGYRFSTIEINPNKLYTNMTTERIPDDLLR